MYPLKNKIDIKLPTKDLLVFIKDLYKNKETIEQEFNSKKNVIKFKNYIIIVKPNLIFLL